MTLADRVLTTRFPGRPGGRPGRPRDPGPAWHRPALLALLGATALLYLWDLRASGNANSFYAAAVQAGSKSWKAWFFGSLDSARFITVDNPPGRGPRRRADRRRGAGPDPGRRAHLPLRQP